MTLSTPVILRRTGFRGQCGGVPDFGRPCARVSAWFLRFSKKGTVPEGSHDLTLGKWTETGGITLVSL